MDEQNNFLKRLFEKLLKEAFTTVLLVLISYYFISEERRTKTDLITLYREDRVELLNTLEKRNTEIQDLYEKIIYKK